MSSEVGGNSELTRKITDALNLHTDADPKIGVDTTIYGGRRYFIVGKEDQTFSLNQIIQAAQQIKTPDRATKLKLAAKLAKLDQAGTEAIEKRNWVSTKLHALLFEGKRDHFQEIAKLFKAGEFNADLTPEELETARALEKQHPTLVNKISGGQGKQPEGLNRKLKDAEQREKVEAFTQLSIARTTQRPEVSEASAGKAEQQRKEATKLYSQAETLIKKSGNPAWMDLIWGLKGNPHKFVNLEKDGRVNNQNVENWYFSKDWKMDPELGEHLVPKDREIFEKLTKAADLGSATAQNVLATWYLNRAEAGRMFSSKDYTKSEGLDISSLPADHIETDKQKAKALYEAAASRKTYYPVAADQATQKLSKIK